MKKKTPKKQQKQQKPMSAQQMKKIAGGATSGAPNEAPAPGFVANRPPPFKRIQR